MAATALPEVLVLPQRVFLLSPARTDGRRARLLRHPRSAFALAVRLREGGATIGEVFSFLSGLYFRGKLAYARAFAHAVAVPHGVLVIVPGLGLLPPETGVTLEGLRAIGRIGVTARPRFRGPLERDAAALAARLCDGDTAVLLGSIASDKYVDVLDRRLGPRLHFPAAFVGRGDMSRGGLLLRCVRSERELEYRPVAGAVHHGPRPPRLEAIR